jgi:hypothetical protein
VNNQPEIAADPHRPEALVLRLVQLVELHARTGRIHLQIEGRGLDELMLFACKSGEAVGEGVGDTKMHAFPYRQFKAVALSCRNIPL